MTDEPNPPTATAYAVSLKLQDFWPSDSELWFAQAEALLIAQNVTREKTKFGHVVRVLPARYASEVRDTINETCVPFKTTMTAAAPSCRRPS